MNIAIFNHYFTDFYTTKNRLSRDGILNYLKSIIDQRHNVFVFDIVKDYKKEIPLPKDLSYLKYYLIEDLSEYSFFYKYYQFGDKNNFNHKILLSTKIDVVLVSSFAFCYFEGFRDTVKYLKKILKDVIIIAGGNGVSANPLYYLKNSLIDYAVVGSAEISLNKLLDSIENGEKIDIMNVLSRYSPNYKIDLNLKYDFKPFIAKINNSNVSLQLTRGCPKNCSYCSVKLATGDHFLFSDLKEIKDRLNSLNIQNRVNFCFEDDNITFKKEYFLEILKYIKQKFRNFTFSFENGVDWRTLSEEYIKTLIDYGLKQFNISLTSININMLKESKREYMKKDFDDFINMLQNYNLPIIVYFICGLPDDNKENIMETLFYLAEKRVILGISMFYPVPNTEIVKKIDKRLRHELCKATSFYKWGKIRTKTLITFFILTRFINAIKKINFLDLSYLKEIFNKIEFIDYRIKINSPLTRKELTILGIVYSIKFKKIFSIKQNEEHYILKEYNCDKRLIKIFFKELLNNRIIFTNYGKIDGEIWKKICKNLFQ